MFVDFFLETLEKIEATGSELAARSRVMRRHPQRRRRVRSCGRHGVTAEAARRVL